MKIHDQVLKFWDQLDDYIILISVVAVVKNWRITSLVRSVEENRRVGGVANSYHLIGTRSGKCKAIDLVLPDGDKMFLRILGKWLGLEIIDEVTHIHVEKDDGIH